MSRSLYNIDAADENGNTTLHYAISYQEFEIAIQLLSYDGGVDVNARNKKNVTPLQLAIANRIPIDCLDNKIPVFEVHDRFRNCIESYDFAINARDEAVLREVGDKIRSDEDIRNLVKMLIDAGADVDARDHNDCSPIHCAIYTGDLELVKILLDAGADIDNQNKVGASPLHDAVLCRNEAMVQLLLDRGACVDLDRGLNDYILDESALLWAAMLNWSNSLKVIIRKLVEAGSDVGEVYQVGEIESDLGTPFDYILMYGDIDLVKFCIEKHEEGLRSEIDESKSDLLRFAVYNEDPRVMNLFLESGITQCTSGLTALHFASGWCRPQHVRQLIAKGIDVNTMAHSIIHRTNSTPLTCSINAVHDEFVEFEIDRPDAAEDRRMVIKLLLDCGANPNQRVNGKTPLEMAISNNSFGDEIYDDAERLIVKHAAEVEARTNEQVFDDYNIKLISKNPELRKYYEKCQAELTAMRNSKIAGTCITHLSVLTEPLEVLARYVKNEEFVKEFGANYRTAYPAYAQQLTEKFEAAVAKQQKGEQVLLTLSRMLPFAEPNFLPFEIISKYLNEKDVNLLIDAYRISH